MRTTRTHLFDLGSYALVAVWVSVAVYVSAANPLVGISDMFGFIPRAQSLSLHDLSPWVDGFYPFGYPLLLKGLSTLIGDYEVSGRVLSLLAGVIALLTVYRTSRSIFTPTVALLALAICCTNPTFLRYSVISSTDMPAVAFLAVGTYCVCRFGVTHELRHLLAGGASIGAAYLIRYNAIAAVPAVLVWLWLQPAPPISWKHRFQQCVLFLSALVASASPQLLLSMVGQGNPFYNLQARNVYFGMYGGGNWGLNMPAAHTIATLSQVVLAHPGVFLSSWYHNLLGVLRLDVVQFPLTLVSFAGMLYCLRRPQSRDRGVLLCLIAVAYTATICMAFPSTRLLLFTTVVLSMFAAFGLVAFVPHRLRLTFPHAVPIRTPCVVALTGWLVLAYTRPAVLHPLSEYDKTRIDVSRTLAQQGIRSVSEVLSFSFDYYDMTKPTKDRFALPWYATEFRPYESVDDIARRMQRAGEQFLVFDDRAPRNVRGLKSIWPFDESDLRRCFEDVATVSGSVHVYRLREMPTNRGPS
jgi:hypothetical protein